MKIGLFTDTYPPYINGVSTSVSMLEEALRASGHQVYIVTVNPEKFSFQMKNNVIKIPGVKTGIYDYRLTGIYPLKAVNKIRKLKLDIIHSHTEFGVGTFARLIAKQLKIPLVHTYHTMYEDYVHYITKGHFTFTSKKIVEYLSNFYCDQTVDELIVPTKKTYDLFKEKYKFDRDVHIIPTGIEIERFYHENNDSKQIKKLKDTLNINDNDFTIMFVGRLAKEKNIDFLIKAHQKLVSTQKNIKLLIVGDGPDMNKLKNESKSLHNNIIFTGKVPWTEIPKYYQIADTFATASKSETQGLTVIEAMAASLPVVAIDDESFNTVIENNVSGFIFNTEEEYIKIIEKLINDKEKRSKIGKKARIVSESYSAKYFAKKVLEVYNIAIQNKKTWHLLEHKDNNV